MQDSTCSRNFANKLINEEGSCTTLRYQMRKTQHTSSWFGAHIPCCTATSRYKASSITMSLAACPGNSRRACKQQHIKKPILNSLSAGSLNYGNTCVSVLSSVGKLVFSDIISEPETTKQITFQRQQQQQLTTALPTIYFPQNIEQTKQ